jgi:hypothetical protein
MKPLPRLHLVPTYKDPREWTKSIQITEKHILASDSYMIIRYPSKNWFGEALGVDSNFAVDPKQWKALTASNVKSVEIDLAKNNLIGLMKNGTLVYVPILEVDKLDWKFPDYQSVWPVDDSPVVQIGFNANLMAKLCTVLEGPLKFVFSGENRGARVFETSGENEGEALIMNCKID